MNHFWNLREELYQAFHRWPVMLASILAGALLGWGFSFLWPAHYRATSELYLALNPYRKFEDTIFEALANPKYSNLDNYQYWQMGQLQGAIYMDSFLQPTLDNLRQQDPYWKDIDISQLRGMLADEWRTTGAWSLNANNPNPKHAQQAASAWAEVSLNMIAQAVQAARRTFMVDQQMQSASDERLRASNRQKDLTSTIEALKEWQLDQAAKDPNQPLETKARWKLLATVTNVAEFTPAWTQALDSAPSMKAPLSAYGDWIAQLIPLMDQEISTMQDHMAEMDKERISLAQQFDQEQRLSLSFSPNIEVLKRLDRDTRVIRPTLTLILVGSIIGLLAWLLIQLVRISNLRSQQ
jgi:hypothetical protein